MKLNTIKQLILRFIGGGKIQIPTRFLKSVDIESPDIKSEITADDITPEFLSNPDVQDKINNYGFTNEQISNLFYFQITQSQFNPEYYEDLQFEIYDETNIIAIYDKNGTQVLAEDDAFSYFPEFFRNIQYINYKYDYGNSVFKVSYVDSEHIELVNINRQVEINMYILDNAFKNTIRVGLDTL